MSVLVTAGQRDARAVPRAPGFHVEIIGDWTEVETRWDGFDAATPFQDARWLAAWYGAFATESSIEPLIVLISGRTTTEPVVVLPLVRRIHNGVRIVEFADLNLTDYNAPLWSAAAPRNATAMRLLWRALRAALRKMPGGADLIRFRKMPVEIDGRINPLTLLPTSPCVLNGNLVVTGDDYDAWRFTLARTVRRELERSWRVFTRDPGAGFRIVSDPAKARHLLATMETQQQSRMAQLGLRFVLNDATAARFYRNLIDHLDSGFAVLSALTAGDEVVATLLGIRRGHRYVMIRISNAGDKWSNCSPGRLIIERTMAALHEDGVRQFDFSVGNYDYKKRFDVVPTPLVDLTAALSWRGWPHRARDLAAQWLRRHPRLDQRVRRVFGKRPSEAGD